MLTIRQHAAARSHFCLEAAACRFAGDAARSALSAIDAVFPHADLASLSGGSRENVTRILSDLQRRGIIERDGRRFVLCRIDGLAKLAGV